MIDNLELTNRQLNKLLLNKVYSGGESIVCDGDNPFSLYKIFFRYGHIVPMSKNKLKKIELLDQMNLDYMIKAIRTVSYNDMIIGYEMSSDYSFDTYKPYQLNSNELICFLENTKYILEYFQENGIIYGDVNFRNILLDRDTMDILFCDIDNIKIGNYSMDVLPVDLINFDSNCGKDNQVHAYMHNIMTLDAFNLDIYCSSNFSINRHFKRGAKKVILSMQDDSVFRNEYLINYIKKA